MKEVGRRRNRERESEVTKLFIFLNFNFIDVKFSHHGKLSVLCAASDFESNSRRWVRWLISLRLNFARFNSNNFITSFYVQVNGDFSDLQNVRPRI